MELKDLYAILAFIAIFKMVTSPRLRGRTAEEPEAADPVSAEPAKKVAPMHMPIQIPPAGLPPLEGEPEKLVIDGPIPDDRSRS